MYLHCLYYLTNTEDTLMAGKQNHGERWDTDSMIRNAKALQRVVKELEKNKPKPSPSDGWGK